MHTLSQARKDHCGESFWIGGSALISASRWPSSLAFSARSVVREEKQMIEPECVLACSCRCARTCRSPKNFHNVETRTITVHFQIY